MVGFLFGISCTIISVLLFSFLAQLFAGGITSLTGESWLYFSLVIPLTIAFIILESYFKRNNEPSNHKLWVMSIICAFTITLYCGTFGAIFGEYVVRVLVRGEQYNWQFLAPEIFKWGTIYAFVLLPITAPFARLIIGFFQELIMSLLKRKKTPS